jgi:hypothetical protein
MAWSDTGDFTSGQILTAAAMDKVREAMFFGQATFTNEAARDTAFANPGALAPITLQEGMRSYLTAPTVPAATGGVTAIPTGITTVYNGSAWVCTTPVSSYTLNSGTTTSGTYTATLSGSPGTNPSVTLSTGTSVIVSIAAMMRSSASGQGATMSVAVSGATTLAAQDAYWLFTDGTANVTSGATFLIGGLTAGSNTFTLNYRVGSGNTLTVQDRRITVQGLA